MPTPVSTPPRSAAVFGRLFQVQVEHRYFLNVGEQDFEQISLTPPLDPGKDKAGAEQQALARAARQAYDLRRFWRVEPTVETAGLLRRNRLLFRSQPDGFALLAELRQPAQAGAQPTVPLLELPANVTFEFAVYLTDPYFSLYTLTDARMLEESSSLSLVPPGTAPLIYGSRHNPRLDYDGELIFDWLTETFSPGVSTPSRTPFCVIRLDFYDPKEYRLLSSAGAVMDHRFRLLLNNRHTSWIGRCTPEAEKPETIGEYPLVYHGRVESGCSCPSPTPATTVAVETPPGSHRYEYRSYIY